MSRIEEIQVGLVLGCSINLAFYQLTSESIGASLIRFNDIARLSDP